MSAAGLELAEALATIAKLHEAIETQREIANAALERESRALDRVAELEAEVKDLESIIEEIR